MDLRELKAYSMAEAIYFKVFDISREDLEGKPLEEVIADYEHLKENIEETLELLTNREQVFLHLVLGDKLSLRAAGDKYDLSPARVRQIVEKAFRKLCHPAYQRILDGSRRQMQMEEDARKEREAYIEGRQARVEAEIEHQKRERLLQIDMRLSLGCESLSLTPICKQKLDALGIRTVGELLEKFPYDSQTNALTGLTVADGMDKNDYYEIWSALFMAGLLIRMPELPDFETLQKIEQHTVILDNISKIRDISVYDLELSVRSYNCLMRSGILSIGDLLDRLSLEIDKFLAADRDAVARMIDDLRIRNLGRKQAEELAERLDELVTSYRI